MHIKNRHNNKQPLCNHEQSYSHEVTIKTQGRLSSITDPERYETETTHFSFKINTTSTAMFFLARAYTYCITKFYALTHSGNKFTLNLSRSLS